jgi:uncharacterized protein DUF2180
MKVVQCYVCAERGIERTAVGLCRSCYAGLCLEHLREAAARLSGNILAGCRHDTWATPRAAPASSTRRAAHLRALASSSPPS